MSQATPTKTDQRLSGREAALARRQALSLYGKKSVTPAQPVSRPAAKAAEPARDDAAACGCRHEAAAPAGVIEYAKPAQPSPAIEPEPLSPARRRRIELSLKGRGDAPPARPCGRVRPQPQKVEVGTTLAGTAVTGNMVERAANVTGNEAGTCRVITGTEYVGAQQYDAFCGASPDPNAPKVAVTHTSRGRRVTGTEVGRSPRVTGDEYGSCKRVTGTEYLAAEQSEQFCGTPPEPGPEKIVAGETRKKIPVTGSDISRRSRVTGMEPGASRAVTGTLYAEPTPAGAEGDAPKKVETRHTSAGNPVSGTLPARSPKLTGDEPGACARVTGSDYLAAEEFVSYCRAEPYQPPAKVGVSRTLRGQEVSGTVVGRSIKVTGDEYGACKPVTGTTYIGADQYAEFCAARAAAEAINRARLGGSPDLTGIQPGPDDKMTGAERGLCQDVTGTPYLGEGQYAAACGGAPMAARFRRRDLAAPSSTGISGTGITGTGITGSAMDGAGPSRTAGGFSITTPARVAQSREVSRITGSVYGGGRITGPLARAAGLVSGTPEFRYREQAGVVAVPPAPAPAPEARVTGEGRERRITGDSWDRGNRVTGTEGHSATRRNPTLRGEARGNGVNARAFRDAETPAPPPSRITGSAGNATTGATVTLSGGARG